MINAMPFYECCVLAPVKGVAPTWGAVTKDYRRWATQPGNAIEIDGYKHTLGAIDAGFPLKAECYGRWRVCATWFPKMRR